MLFASCAKSADDVGSVEDVGNVADMPCSSSGYKEIAGEHIQKMEDLKNYIKELRFTDALTGQIKEAEDILAEFKNLDMPACYQPAHDRFMAGIEYDAAAIKYQGETLGEISEDYENAKMEYAAGEEELKKLDNN
jgi:hypothetical protein